MKVAFAVVTSLASVSSVAQAFQVSTSSTSKASLTTQLQGHKNVFWGSAASVVAGLTFAGQVATASIPDEPFLVQQAPTTITAAGYETLDFSLPSYDETVKGGTAVKKDLPSFNPFGDFQPDFVKPDTSADDSEKAAAKAAAEAKKAEEKAAAEAKRAEERAAREAKRQKKEEVVETVETTDTQPDALSFPEFKVPEFKAPEISIPDFKAPDFKAPDFKAPEISFPDFKAPELPKFSIPKLDFDSSKLDIPKVDVPKIDLPKVDFPTGVSLPSFGGFGGSSTTSDSAPKEYSPQDVRDEAARSARQEYLRYDEIAKDVEAQARAAREAAKEKLKDAKDAKDLACETRPGGKLICLRNPFTAGF